MNILKYKKGYIPPLAFAVLMVIILILIVAFVPEVKQAVMDMLNTIFSGGSTQPTPINTTP